MACFLGASEVFGFSVVCLHVKVELRLFELFHRDIRRLGVVVHDGGGSLEVLSQGEGLHVPVEVDVLQGEVRLVLDATDEVFAVTDEAVSLDNFLL